MRASNRRRCSAWLTSRKYFNRMIPLLTHLALDCGREPKKVLVLVVAAEPHDPLDPCPVVPGPIEQDDLAGCGEMGEVALDVQLALLPIRGRGQCDVLEHAGAAALHDAADHAALAGGVPPLEHDDHPRALGHRPRLQPRQLDLQLREFFLELLARHRRRRGNAICGRLWVCVLLSLALGQPQHSRCRCNPTPEASNAEAQGSSRWLQAAS